MSKSIEKFDYSEPAKVIFSLIDCAPRFIKNTSAESWSFTVSDSNGCFNALFIIAFVLLFVCLVLILSLVGVLICLANVNKRIDKINYFNSNPNKFTPKKTHNKAKLKSDSSSTSETSSSSELESELETKKPRRHHQSRKDSKKVIKQEEKISTIRLPRYKVYKEDASGKDVVIQMSETLEKKLKTSGKKQKHTDEDELSLNEMKRSRSRKRSKYRESRHSRHSSSHSARHSKATKNTRY